MSEEVEQPATPGPKGRIKRTPIVDAIITNEAFKGTAEYRSVRELAEQFGVLPATVYTHRTRLGFRKLINVASNGQRHTEKVPVPAELSPGAGPQNDLGPRNRSGLMQSYTRAATTTDDLVRSLEGEGIISPIDRLKMLSRMIRVGSPMIKIAAIKAIEDLSKATEGRVGPPAPLTEEERVVRATRLMLAVGQTTIDSAYDAAFPPLPQGTPPESLQDDLIGLPNTLGDPTGPLLDLPTAQPTPSGP